MDLESVNPHIHTDMHTHTHTHTKHALRGISQVAGRHSAEVFNKSRMKDNESLYSLFQDICYREPCTAGWLTVLSQAMTLEFLPMMDCQRTLCQIGDLVSRARRHFVSHLEAGRRHFSIFFYGNPVIIIHYLGKTKAANYTEGMSINRKWTYTIHKWWERGTSESK